MGVTKVSTVSSVEMSKCRDHNNIIASAAMVATMTARVNRKDKRIRSQYYSLLAICTMMRTCRQ